MIKKTYPDSVFEYSIKKEKKQKKLNYTNLISVLLDQFDNYRSELNNIQKHKKQTTQFPKKKLVIDFVKKQETALMMHINNFSHCENKDMLHFFC